MEDEPAEEVSKVLRASRLSLRGAMPGYDREGAKEAIVLRGATGSVSKKTSLVVAGPAGSKATKVKRSAFPSLTRLDSRTCLMGISTLGLEWCPCFE